MRKFSNANTTKKEDGGRKNSSFHHLYRNVFISDTLVANSIASFDDKSTSASTHNTFTEKDFKLPDLEVMIGMDLNDVLLHDKHKHQFTAIKHEIIRERNTLSRLDTLAHTTDEKLALQHKKGVKLGASATTALATSSGVATRPNGLWARMASPPGASSSPAAMSVAMNPGATEVTAMPCGARATAIDWPKACIGRA